MSTLPEDHPERRIAADEVHARPQEPIESPHRASYLAIMIDPADREREREHIAALCASFDVPPPPHGANHFIAQLASIRLTWERHGEFSGYLLLVPESSARPFDETASSFLPREWVGSIPGRTIVAAHATLLSAQAEMPNAAVVAGLFDGNVPVGASIGDGAGAAFTDFRIHDDGYVRFVIVDGGLTPRQSGRTLQRLFEIEAYRVMALLSLPIARRLGTRIFEAERALGGLTDAIARETGSDEAMLSELTKVAAEVESARNASQMRFSASRAYHDLVRTRILELRERRVAGIQTIEEFMNRRLTPAMATCVSVEGRLRDLSERVANASSLLSTRVEIARERQNQALLASMERRARLQLRLQQTVEWLSVAAVTYYGASLAGYAAKAAKSSGIDVNPDVVVAVSIPCLALFVAWTIHRVRRRLSG